MTEKEVEKMLDEQVPDHVELDAAVIGLAFVASSILGIAEDSQERYSLRLALLSIHKELRKHLKAVERVAETGAMAAEANEYNAMMERTNGKKL
mgnify:CR=1 FL=1